MICSVQQFRDFRRLIAVHVYGASAARILQNFLKRTPTKAGIAGKVVWKSSVTVTVKMLDRMSVVGRKGPVRDRISHHPG